MSATSSIQHSSDPQQPNGFLGKPVGLLPPQPTSHDGHMTQDSSEYDQAAQLEDPFYNFSEMGQNSIEAVFDPANPNSISFLDENFTPAVTGSESGEVPPGSEFNPELFNSILSTGDAILSRLESGSATSGSLSVGGASIGDEEGLGSHERMGSWDEGVTDSVFPPSGDSATGEGERERRGGGVGGRRERECLLRANGEGSERERERREELGERELQANDRGREGGKEGGS